MTANASAFLKDGSVNLVCVLDDAILLLRCCYVTSLPKNTHISYGIRDITTERRL